MRCSLKLKLDVASMPDHVRFQWALDCMLIRLTIQLSNLALLAARPFLYPQSNDIIVLS